jgi:hypothetical protein
MFENVDWTTVVLSLCGTFIGAISVATGMMFKIGRTYGKTETDLEHHEERLNLSNGALKRQADREREVGKKLTRIETNCEERLLRLDRNDREHDEIFGRLRSLEVNIASIPGQVAKQIDAKFAEWRRTLKGDIGGAFSDYMNERGRKSRSKGDEED